MLGGAGIHVSQRFGVLCQHHVVWQVELTLLNRNAGDSCIIAALGSISWQSHAVQCYCFVFVYQDLNKDESLSYNINS